MILTFTSDPNAFNCRFTVNVIIDVITVIWWSSSGIKLEMQFQSCVANSYRYLCNVWTFQKAFSPGLDFPYESIHIH